MQNAIDKLRDEMAQHANDPYVQYVGGYLTNHILKHPADALKILQKEKTIKGSLDAAKAAAKSKAVNGCAVMADDEVMKTVFTYFGLGAEKPKTADVCGFGVPDLDALLEG